MKHFKQDVSYLSINQSFLNLLKLGFEQSKNDLKPVKKTFYSFQFSKTYESNLLKSEYLVKKSYSLDETSFMIEHS